MSERLVVEIDADLHHRIKTRAVEEKKTMKEIVQNILNDKFPVKKQKVKDGKDN